MKILRYIVLAACCLIWVVGLSPTILPWLWKEQIVEDGYQYGDLYKLSTLSEFRDPRHQCTDYVPPARPKSAKKVHLYIIGDSFTEKGRVGLSDFPVDEYTWVKWSDFLHIKLDTTQHNILLMESVERHFRQKFASSAITVLVPDSATFIQNGASSKFMHQLDEAFKGSHTADRLDGFLFQNDFALRIKEWKSDFNHRFFDRTASGVTLVNNDRDVVYYMDTDTPEVTSSFTPMRETELDSIITNVNASRDFADSLGFDHVILSIIPNKVSVLSPDYGVYNNLIERVYNHAKLDIPYIDVLGDFRRMGRSSYMKGDSHWTCEGQTIWLNKINALLNQLVAGPAS
ncbi:hypothetical protein J2Y45_001372 [Dyadobacter sp. BE34]|uniref:AlgX/AlgJ SGNH hydrolase-like domain-containing protein n=1 Tax=Dyadobacter fermentans TaxID=94254 RepID=A0ABU1QSG0_9BACT|nr:MULTISPECIES: hypothetical protein [Dyadobacter]MDR6804103.1 hypothetical protein [Dyadobacter fermentans]MDR7041843.1 hypothetical protein [Dyadobacter sp. BE242]MDR7196246.1 hypothetical protein [Dyadobacter sp. BE34]MDR7213209.1 hypothetical protein [Dyadobacter sp. BE31]MDR7261652.1 hypothetical protein [Dyadobacter sp. BE32]